MGALDRFLRRGRQQEGYKPLMKRLEAALLAACRAAGASAWYIPDDFLTLGPELVTNGKFDNGLTGWTNTNAVASVVSDQGGNVLSLSQAGGSANLGQAISLDAGKAYQISFKRRGIAVGSGLSGRISFIYSDASSSQTPTAAVTVRSDYESVVDVLVPAKPITVFRLIATTSSADNVGTVYFDDISIREIMSAKDFQDSVGTLPTYLGGTVGMMFDAAGVTGSELIAKPHTSANWLAEGTTPPTAVNGADSYLGKGCRSVTFPALASGGYSVCRARDAESTFTVATGVNYAASFEYALSRDLTAGESIALAITGSSGIYSKSVSAGAPGGVWISATGGQPALASGGGTSLRPFATTLNAPLTVYIRALSVKVSGGNVVTQATAGNRPTVSRIPRKLGPELATGVVITGTNGTNTGSSTANSFTINQVDATSVVNASISLSKSTTPGASYLLSSTPSSLSGNGFKVDSTSWTPSAASVTANTVLTATNVPTSQIQVYRSAPPAAGAFSNISVREVLEWSYVLPFDGNDSLAATASVIGSTLTQPYTMIAWGKVGAIGSARAMQGDSARWVGISSSGKAIVSNSGTASQIGTTTLQQGAAAIIEAVWDGSAMSLYLNGAREVNQAATGAPATAASFHSIGQAGGAVNFYNDQIGGAIVCPAVMTDAQRLAVRRFAAAQMGLVL